MGRRRGWGETGELSEAQKDIFRNEMLLVSIVPIEVEKSIIN